MTNPVDLAAPGAGAQSVRPALGAARPRYGEKAIKALLFLCAALAVAVTVAIVINLFLPTVGFFRQVSIVDFLTGTLWAPRIGEGAFGVLPVVVGTLYIVGIGLAVAIPVGLLSAIYLSEYARPWLRRVVKPLLEVLEGIPTVAFGVFGLMFATPFLQDLLPFLPWQTVFSIGVAGVLVGLLIVPLVASVADDALRAVPAGLREGAYALGASRLRVTLRIAFPAAISGIIAAVVLGASRAVGETMIVLMVAGAGYPYIQWNPFAQGQAMTSYVAGVATGDIPHGGLDYATMFVVGALLFTMTLAMNMVAIRLVRRFREVYE